MARASPNMARASPNMARVVFPNMADRDGDRLPLHRAAQEGAAVRPAGARTEKHQRGRAACKAALCSLCPPHSRSAAPSVPACDS
eukprot:3733742-Prymnesium_polylepis.1